MNKKVNRQLTGKQPVLDPLICLHQQCPFTICIYELVEWQIKGYRDWLHGMLSFIQELIYEIINPINWGLLI